MKIKEVIGPRSPNPIGLQTPEHCRVNSLKGVIDRDQKELHAEIDSETRRRAQRKQAPKRLGSGF